MGGAGRFAAGSIDDVANAAIVVEADGDHGVEADAGGVGGFDRVADKNIGVVEDAVDAETPSLVGGDVGVDFVGGEAIGL